MLVQITKTHLRALDPRTVLTLTEGEVKDFDKSFADRLINAGCAIEHAEQKALDLTISNKAITGAPENKDSQLEKEARERFEAKEKFEAEQLIKETEAKALAEEAKLKEAELRKEELEAIEKLKAEKIEAELKAKAEEEAKKVEAEKAATEAKKNNKKK